MVKTVRHIRDVPLALRLGWFVVRAPADLERRDVRAFLDRIRTARRLKASDVHESMQRIVRVRQAWLSLPVIRRRNTCYVRALALYRFLDGGGRHVGIHFGVEPPRVPGDRLRGHAWVTVDGEVIEGPPEIFLSRVAEVKLDRSG